MAGGRVASGTTLDTWLLLRVLMFAFATRLLVRLNPSFLRRMLARRGRPGSVDADLVSRISDHVDLALRIGRPLVPAGCLTRGLTLYRFLTAAGSEVTLRFGLGMMDGRYDGHCWLERDGVPILEVVDPRPLFQVTFSIP